MSMSSHLSELRRKHQALSEIDRGGATQALQRRPRTSSNSSSRSCISRKKSSGSRLRSRISRPPAGHRRAGANRRARRRVRAGRCRPRDRRPADARASASEDVLDACAASSSRISGRAEAVIGVLDDGQADVRPGRVREAAAAPPPASTSRSALPCSSRTGNGRSSGARSTRWRRPSSISRAGDRIGIILVGRTAARSGPRPRAGARWARVHAGPDRVLGEVGRGRNPDQPGDPARHPLGEHQRDPAAHAGAHQQLRPGGQPRDRVRASRAQSPMQPSSEVARGRAVAGIVEPQVGLAARPRPGLQELRLGPGHVRAEAAEEHHPRRPPRLRR